MKFCSTTVESGAIYRVCERTGITREVKTTNMFSGVGTRTDEQVKVWEMLHPDDPADERVESPYGKNEKPVGVGKFLGIEWRAT